MSATVCPSLSPSTETCVLKGCSVHHRLCYLRKITRVIVFKHESELPDEAVKDAAKRQIEGEFEELPPSEGTEAEYEELPAWKEWNGRGGNGHG
jgi:hypothetical protein